jgi:hypothetical protein
VVLAPVHIELFPEIVGVALFEELFTTTFTVELQGGELDVVTVTV